MPPRVELAISKKQITKAGKRLREFWKSGFADEEGILEAWDVVSEFRKAHAYPLQMVSAQLRYYPDKHCGGAEWFVAQRLKRMPTIVEKLVRSPNMALVTMQDIGGCRAVVPTLDQLNAIRGHLRRRWDNILEEDDYIASPKPQTGYRAHHLIVEKEGRRIEVQLRTATQHRWAEYVETTDRRNQNLGLKSGRAPDDVLEYFRLGSEVMAHIDAGRTPEGTTVRRFGQLHLRIGQQLQEGTYGQEPT